MKFTAGDFRHNMRHNLYRKPRLPRSWEHDMGQKKSYPLMYARDEAHAEQIRQRIKQGEFRILANISIEINPEVFRHYYEAADRYKPKPQPEENSLFGFLY